MKFVAALNSLNTPWIAILVILIGIGSEAMGIKGESPATIIGAGVGLLTGQALAKLQQTQEPMPPVPAPATPAVVKEQP